MNALLALAVLSLMLPIRMETGLILVRPFEFLIALGMLGWPLIAARRGVRRVPVGLLLLLPYLTWHVASATVGGPRNTAREALQVFVVTMFAFLLAQEAPRIDVKRLSRRLLLGMAAIAAGTITWHVAHGYWVGWKQIPDARLVFVFLPLLLAGLILFAEAEKRRRLHFVWAGMLPLLVMSGERKALVIYLILTVLLFARGRLGLIAPGLAAAFAGLLLLSTVVENPYLQKQIRTLVEPGGTGNYEYVLATGQYLPGDTPSNVQRAFSLHVSSQMLAEHPLVGVGTNQYEEIVGETYPTAPKELLLAIHGEFQRIVTENGLLGFSLYALVWVAAWARLSRVLRRALDRGRLTSTQVRVLPLLLFTPIALFVGTEASGTRAFIGVIVISLLPELVGGALARAREPMLLPAGLAARPKPAFQLAGGAS
jgi:O-Antigen ligase